MSPTNISHTVDRAIARSTVWEILVGLMGESSSRIVRAKPTNTAPVALPLSYPPVSA